jgi:hypothetical protein
MYMLGHGSGLGRFVCGVVGLGEVEGAVGDEIGRE